VGDDCEAQGGGVGDVPQCRMIGVGFRGEDF
jgi:hypothetical protein